MPETNYNDERVLMAFVDKMVTDKDANVSGGARTKLRGQLFEEMNRRIERAMIEALPDQLLIELDKSIDNGMTDEEIDEFFEGTGIGFSEVVQQAMKDFREAYLNGSVVIEEEA